VLTPLAAAAGIFAASEGSASAQEWLKDRRYQEGSGIRVGDLELHPGIGGEIGYDSNWFLRTHKTAPAGQEFVNGPPNNEAVGAGVLRLTPSFSVSTLSPQRLEGTEGNASGASTSTRSGRSASASSRTTRA
jgi:hypothetical protein